MIGILTRFQSKPTDCTEVAEAGDTVVVHYTVSSIST